MSAEDWVLVVLALVWSGTVTAIFVLGLWPVIWKLSCKAADRIIERIIERAPSTQPRSDSERGDSDG